jgi:hypothetical protein
VSAEQAVLVPVVLGAGLLFSLATLARDIVHRLRGHRWLDRRRLVEGRTSAALVIGGPPSARATASGVRTRWAYAFTAVVFLGLAAYTLRGSWGNFVGWTWWARGITWLFCIMVVIGAVFGVVGATALALLLHWPEPPTWTRPLLVRTPIGAIPADERAPTDRPEIDRAVSAGAPVRR